jgi:glycosyltransferase involved in cell wall biosynthesis
LYRIYYEPPKITDNPLISIVIVAYNEEEYIGKLLESIKAGNYSKIEVIIVDDHSIDRTIEIAKSFEKDFLLKIVQKPVRGVSRSRNYGAKFADGEIVLFLDADVTLPQDFIAKNLEVFIKHKLSIAAVDFIPKTEKKIDTIIISFYRLWLKTVQYYNPRGIGFCLFVCKSLHQQTLFDETIIMSEDFDYVKRATQYGKFRIITKLPIEVSWRRFSKENGIILILKYLFFEWYRQNIGEIRKKILPYEFGGYEPPLK